MSSTNAEHSSFIGDYCPTEFRNVECVAQGNLVGDHLFDIEEMNGFTSPLEVVHELVWRVTLLEDEGVMEQFVKLFNDVHIVVVGNAATQLSELSNFENEILLNLIELWSDELEGVEVPLRFVLLEVNYLFLQFVELLQNHSHLDHDGLLSLLSILQVPKSFLFKVAIDKKTLDFFELCEQVIKFLVIVLFDVLNFLSHAP